MQCYEQSNKNVMKFNIFNINYIMIYEDRKRLKIRL